MLDLPRRVFQLFAGPLVITACAAAPPRAPAADDSGDLPSASAVALTGARVIDGTGAPPLEDAVVLIEGDRIACVGDCRVPSGAEVIDVRGRHIIPGLVDVHVHYGLTGWIDGIPGVFGIDVSDRFPYPDVLSELREDPGRFHRSYLCSGVTAVYEPGGFPWTWGFQADSERSTDAPHYMSAGPVLTSLETIIPHPDGSAMSIQMEDETTVRAAVRMLARSGSGAVKIHRPDLIRDGERRRALLQAAGEEARRLGMGVIANAPTLESAKEALRAGATLLVYPVEDAPIDGEFLELARRNDLVYAPAFEAGAGSTEIQARSFDEARLPLECVDPDTRRKAFLTDSLPPAGTATATIIPEQAETVRRIRTENLRRVYEAGIAVAVGASGGAPLVLHGPATVFEMEAMARAGMSAMDVLVAATRNGARAMGRLGDFGTLEPGKLADMVVLESDPLADITNVRSVALVVRGGTIWTRAELEYR